MKKLLSVLSVLLVAFLLISSMPMALAQGTLEYNYDNSVWITYQTHISNQKTAQEFASLFSADACYIMDKQTKNDSVAYQVVAVVENEPVEEVIEREENRMGVLHIGRNVYAPDYAQKESYLTLNQTEVEIPVGGTATLKVTEAHLAADEKQETGIMVAVDHDTLSFQQFLGMIKEMGTQEAEGDDAYFYALYEDDYNWESDEQYLFLGFWGSDEYGPRHNKQSPIGKYLIPIDCFYFLTPEQTLNRLVEVPQITDVRLAYEVAPSGIPPHEKWTVENEGVVGLATDAKDRFDQFYNVTVVGRQVGQIEITVQHGGGSRICYATCTVTVVEANPESPTDIVFGDVNGDQTVDAKDALNVLKNSVKKLEFTPLQTLAAEVDGVEGISAKDALQILKYSVKKITKFPVLELAVTPTDITPTNP